ncbi:MAG: hypothetical protein WC389_15285, partial [Lutibacter sp.]
MAEEHKIVQGTLEEIATKLAVEQVPDPVVEPEKPIEDKTTEKDPVVPETFDKYKYLSEQFETEIKDDEGLNTFKNSLNEKIKKFDQLQQDYEKAQSELKAINPLKFFANKDKYIENQLLIKYPDLDSSILSKVLTNDIEKMDVLQIITYKELLKDSKGEIFESESDAYDFVCKKTGYDKDLSFDEQDQSVKIAIKAMAKEAREEFNKLKSEIEVPVPIDLTAEKTKQSELAQANYDKMKPLIERDLQAIQNGLDKIEITTKENGKDEVLFSYNLEEFKNSKIVKDTIQQVIEFTARNAREWNKEIAEKVISAT